MECRVSSIWVYRVVSISERDTTLIVKVLDGDLYLFDVLACEFDDSSKIRVERIEVFDRETPVLWTGFTGLAKCSQVSGTFPHDDSYYVRE